MGSQAMLGLQGTVVDSVHPPQKQQGVQVILRLRLHSQSRGQVDATTGTLLQLLTSQLLLVLKKTSIVTCPTLLHHT